MASDDPREQYRSELDTLSRFTDEGRVTPADADAIREFLRAKDGEDMAVTDPEGDTPEPSSLAAYCHRRPNINQQSGDITESLVKMDSLEEHQSNFSTIEFASSISFRTSSLAYFRTHLIFMYFISGSYSSSNSGRTLSAFCSPVLANSESL